MLTLTDNAVVAIRDLMVGEDVPPDAGLRIAAKPDEAGALELSLASTPQAGDQVIEQEDVRVFVAEDTVAILDDKSLDARPGSPGRPSFRLDRRD
ncbi:Fe-S cluster assembly protein HesB [Actinomadura sp. ATCC 31491]|uniref:Fe-S cluster assembly protein HesB n=1 Tax=Actinomadura luzonensis TaxID=2805427 RepID=A0ABT0FKJ2_9ACTN|nr:Fe-S cluster assembly protein HesB [Actinomadura luzonensis]MCK2212830.1 Fe-S cluster assembly protein HesB [Actinomadura luzonensis]